MINYHSLNKISLFLLILVLTLLSLQLIGRYKIQFGQAVSSHLLPNALLTPGVPNPNITQANINQNICNPRWSTKSIRPASSYTTGLKKTQLVQYGYADTNLADFEEDHLISLELGGSPTDPKNLWPESYLPKPGAREKDQVENYLHAQVCSGALKLTQAQTMISTDWYAVYQKMKPTLGSLTAYQDPDDQ